MHLLPFVGSCCRRPGLTVDEIACYYQWGLLIRPSWQISKAWVMWLFRAETKMNHLNPK